MSVDGWDVGPDSDVPVAFCGQIDSLSVSVCSVGYSKI
jgi:hypothetical protein